MKRPLLLTLVMWFTGLWALGAVLGIAAVAWGYGKPDIGGIPVDRATWLRVAAPLLALIALLMSLTSIGLARHRAWARWPFLAIPPLIAAYALGCGLAHAVDWMVAARAFLGSFLFLLFALWICLRRPANVAFFTANK